MNTQIPQNQRVVSGMRPTGKLHLGHYHGVLKNWVEMQLNYECFFFVADWQICNSRPNTYLLSNVDIDRVDSLLLSHLI